MASEFIGKPVAQEKSKLQLEVEDLEKKIADLQKSPLGFNRQNQVVLAAYQHKLKRLKPKLTMEMEAQGLELDALKRQKEESLSETKAMLRATQQSNLRKMQMEKGGRLGTIKAGY